MISLYALKTPLIILLIGFLVRIVSALMKIMHWQGADIGLWAGTSIMTTGIIWLIVKLVLLKKEGT